MAYSMQNDFVSLPYDDFPSVQLKSETKLKTYDSCVDTRAWDLDNSKKSKYLADILQKLKLNSTLFNGSGDCESFFDKQQLETMTKDQLINHILALYEKVESTYEKPVTKADEGTCTDQPKTTSCKKKAAEIQTCVIKRCDPDPCCSLRVS